MKYLIMMMMVCSFSLSAQDKEGDLQIPVSDLSQIERQEEELPPSIEEVEMRQKQEKKNQNKKKSTSSSDKNLTSP